MKEYCSGILEKVRSYCSCCFILPLLSVCAPNRAIMCYNVVVTSYKLNIYASVKLVSTPFTNIYRQHFFDERSPWCQ